jgi:DNA-binding CsgD family transcriptional regulator
VLGRREKQVLKFIAEGQRSVTIAKQTGITVATVEAHRCNILRKLQLHSAADLARFALRHGMITLEKALRKFCPSPDESIIHLHHTPLLDRTGAFARTVRETNRKEA